MSELHVTSSMHATDAALHTHSRVDVVAALRSTEVVEAKDRKKSTKSSKQQRSGLSSPTQSHHTSSHHTKRHTSQDHNSSSGGRHHRKSDVSSIAGGGAAGDGSGGSFLHELLHKPAYRRASKPGSGWRVPSPSAPQVDPSADAKARGGNVESDNAQTVRNSPPPNKESFYLTKPKGGTTLEEPDSNGMSNSANLHANSRSNSFTRQQQQHHQQQQQLYARQPLVPVTVAGSLPVKNSSSTSGGACLPVPENHEKTTQLDPSAANRTSSGQEPYKFVFPSFATDHTHSAQPSHHAKGHSSNPRNALDMSVPAHSTTKLASSAPIDMAVGPPSQQPEAVYGHSAIPARRHGKKSLTQRLVSNARRPWQSLGEWNFSAAPLNGTFAKVEAFFSGEEEVSYKPSHGRRSLKGRPRLSNAGGGTDGDEDGFLAVSGQGSGGSHDNDAPEAGNMPHGNYPSIFGSPNRAGSPPQSFAVLPEARQSTYMPGLAYAGPSVMWRSAFNNFASGDRDDAPDPESRMAGQEAVQDGEPDFTLMPQESLYNTFGAAGQGNTMYSFFSPMGVPPPAAFAGDKGGVEESAKNTKSKKERIRRPAPQMRGTVKVLSLNVEAPLSASDKEEEDPAGLNGKQSENANGLPLAAPLSGSAPSPKQVNSKATDKIRVSAPPAASPPSTPTRRPFVKKSSLFVASNASFHHRLPRAVSTGEPDFWDLQESDTELKDADSVGKLVDAREHSLPNSDSGPFVGLDRKATMYGRRWLEETGRGGVHGGRGESAGLAAPAPLHAVSGEPHPTHRPADDHSHSSTSSSGSGSGSSSDSSHSDEDSSSDTSGDEHQGATHAAAHPHHHSHHSHHSHPTRPRESGEGDAVVDDALPHYIVSGAAAFDGDGIQQHQQEEDDYARAYPTAPAPPAYATAQPGMSMNAPPTPAIFLPPTLPGRSVNGYPFVYPRDPQQQRQQRYRQAVQMAVVNGYRPAGWRDHRHANLNGARAAAYVQTFGRDQAYQVSPNQGNATSPDYSVSPTGHGVPFRQTAAGSQKVHEMLGFDPVREIRWVRSPEWRRLSIEGD